jgi:hypothetical protein
LVSQALERWHRGTPSRAGRDRSTLPLPAGSGCIGQSYDGRQSILVVTGLDAEFTAVDQWGASSALVSTEDVGVKSNDSGSDLLGMLQLADQSTTVVWNPHTKKGQLSM